MKIRSAVVGATLLSGFTGIIVAAGAASPRDDGEVGTAANRAGVMGTVSTAGEIDTDGPFFQVLGTNGRSCVTCHQPSEAWGVSVEGIRRRFQRSDGLDPIFRLVDGANTPNADVSTVAKRYSAYSMLLNRGVIRIERPIPANAEFTLLAADDPYNHASSSGLSLFRRPLPTTNLRFISTVMWDGREVDPTTPMTIANSFAANSDILLTSLSNQALDATNGHAQAAIDLTAEQKADIVSFEMGLTTAQKEDHSAGHLEADGALGGARKLQSNPFYIGINDNVADPAGPFNAHAMNLFAAWANSKNPHRASIARGQEIFNSKPITITNVNGLNDNPYFGRPASLTGSCTTCHNTPGVGDHSLAVALNIGLTDASRRTNDMPLYTLKNNSTGQTVQTTDPGLALSTGKWKDIGRFKGPVLRGLAGRAPYFHNGFAADLGAVVDFYRDRFGVNFTPLEKEDLINFLQSL